MFDREVEPATAANVEGVSETPASVLVPLASVRVLYSTER